jgi:hypothetical protein
LVVLEAKLLFSSLFFLSHHLTSSLFVLFGAFSSSLALQEMKKVFTH